jgi:polysaccharide pyruvyl transferase WcaK-like protein
MTPTRIAFYGNFGAGNLGNEVTLQTAIEQTLRRVPHAQLLCICTNPDDVRARHGIHAIPSTAARLGPSPARSAVGRALRGLFRRLPGELRHSLECLKVLRRCDLLVVPGTGIVTDHGCGPMSWPYDMLKLSVLATLCRKKVLFLSVGVGPIHHSLGRWLIKSSLRLASYRSYRDQWSKRCVEAIGFDASRDAVYPDLVFGLSRGLLPPNAAQQRQTIVGLGLKDYSGPIDGPRADSYREYLDAMADFVLALQSRGYGVRLLIGDVAYDTRVREDFIQVLQARSAVAPLPLCESVPTVAELLRQLAETDVVVSPRFHNLVLALMLEKPVIALSDLPKVEALLTDLGLARYCLSLDTLRPAELLARFEQLQGEAERLKSCISDQVEKYRQALGEQYAAVFAGEIASR